MPTANQKAMNAAADPVFQSRIRLALVRTALTAIEDENSARCSFAKKVLTGSINLPVIAIAVVANTSVGASIDAAEEGDETWGVDDDSIAFVVAENNDPSTGVFAKMARANG